MAREANPYSYANPAATIGATLGRALFGDPQARLQQQQVEAEMAERQARAQEATSHARLYGAQTDGVTIGNDASRSLPELFRSMQPMPRQAPPETLDGFLSPDYQPAPAETQQDAIRRGLPAVLAAMAQMNGDKVDPRQILGTLGAFSGDDGLGRAALIAQGATPGKAFAVDATRADDIAQQGYDADYRKSTGVASINHSNDIPVANIRAGASRDVATINNRDDVPVAQIAAGSRENVAAMKGNNALGSAIAGMYPGVRLTSQDRTQAQQDALIASGATKAVNSHHVPGNGAPAVDMAPIPGRSLAQQIADMRSKGYQVVEAKNEGGGPNDGTGPHWHIAAYPPAGAKGGGGRGGSGKPRAVSKSASDQVDAELKSNYVAMGAAPVPTVAGAVRMRALELYQQTGNPAKAAQMAIQERAAMGRQGRKQGTAVEQWTRDASGKLVRAS